jgi:hypothetical protein
MAYCPNCGGWILFHHSHCKACDKNVWQRTAESRNDYGDVGRPHSTIRQDDSDSLVCAGCGFAILSLRFVKRGDKYYHKKCLP